MKRRDGRGACWPQRRLRAGAFRAGRLPKSGQSRRRRCRGLHCRSGGHLCGGSFMGVGERVIWQPSGLAPDAGSPAAPVAGAKSRTPLEVEIEMSRE